MLINEYDIARALREATELDIPEHVFEQQDEPLVAAWIAAIQAAAECIADRLAYSPEFDRQRFEDLVHGF